MQCVHNTKTCNTKTLQNFKLLGVVVESVQSTYFRQAVMNLFFIFRNPVIYLVFLCQAKCSGQQFTYTVQLLCSIKSHFWGCWFSKWCLGIHQQSLRRLLWPAVFLLVMILRCYLLLIKGTNFCVTEIVFYSKFCNKIFFVKVQLRWFEDHTWSKQT